MSGSIMSSTMCFNIFVIGSKTKSKGFGYCGILYSHWMREERKLTEYKSVIAVAILCDPPETSRIVESITLFFLFEPTSRLPDESTWDEADP